VRRILIASALIVGLATLAIGRASGQSGSGPLWATVNTCTPDAVGVRASLPGDGTRKRMRVRFSAQWYSPSQQAWLAVGGVASSPWLDAGSAQYAYQQTGWTFHFDRPTGGAKFQVRGVAEMQWLSGGQVARSATRVTQAGALGVSFGSSQASCAI
jgi:hypothetical protein